MINCSQTGPESVGKLGGRHRCSPAGLREEIKESLNTISSNTTLNSSNQDENQDDLSLGGREEGWMLMSPCQHVHTDNSNETFP